MTFSTKFSKRVFSFLDLDGDKTVSLDEWDFLALWEKRISNESPDDGSARANIGGPPMRGNGLTSAKESTQHVKSAWQVAVGSSNGHNGAETARSECCQRRISRGLDERRAQRV